jgi:hypothetical protein
MVASLAHRSQRDPRQWNCSTWVVMFDIAGIAAFPRGTHNAVCPAA